MKTHFIYTENELLAIVTGVEYSKHYLSARNFQSDHN